MGLAIEVEMLADQLVHDQEGAEWIRRSVDAVNAVLMRNGASTFTEPTTASGDQRRGIGSYPYSFLHYLRRAYAFAREGMELTPTEELDADSDSVVEDASTMFDSHLLCHSDCEGFYAPVDFADPIFDDDVPGGMLGSSHGLRRELLDIAPALGIELANDAPTAAAIDKLIATEDGTPFWRENIVWLSLWEACRVSIERSSMIVFC